MSQFSSSDLLVPLGRALDRLDELIAHLDRFGALVTARDIAGDARRFEPLVRTPALIVASPDPAALIDVLSTTPGVAVTCRSSDGALLTLGGTEVDLRVAEEAEYGSVLFRLTGSEAHVDAVTSRLHGAAALPTEADVYRACGLPWIPPELRHDTGELEAAATATLPNLVTRADIRGDLHLHSDFSDGQNPVETMVRAAAELGYEYMAITDHSARAAASRTLTLDALARQRDEIARLREEYPRLTILHGVEVDIMPDGSLDFDDDVLEPLDIVLASLHDPAGHDGPALTRRCLQAIRHPLVNVITHPANQLVGRRGGYALDFMTIYEAAAESGTALEIDGAPSHLDLDGERARAAVSVGVTVTIDSDCHRVQALDRQMRLGVGTARRGWVEPRHVLTCQPVEAVRAFVRTKRRRRSDGR